MENNEKKTAQEYKSRLKEVLKHTGKITELDIDYCYDLSLPNKGEIDRLKSDIERWKQEYAILLEGNNKLREENKLFANNLWASVKSNEKLREAFEELSEKYSEGREPIKDYWRKRAGLTDKEVGG